MDPARRRQIANAHIGAGRQRSGMTGKRWSTDEKIRIVLQMFNPETNVAEICRQHNLVPSLLVEGVVHRGWARLA